MSKIKIKVEHNKISKFCRSWKINEFAIFGSALREDFRADSDIDVLVSFDADAKWGLFEFVDMMEELKMIFGRNVDLVEKEALRNPFRRQEILQNNEIIYAA